MKRHLCNTFLKKRNLSKYKQVFERVFFEGKERMGAIAGGRSGNECFLFCFKYGRNICMLMGRSSRDGNIDNV